MGQDRGAVGKEGENEGRTTYASDNLHQPVRVRLGEPSSRVHLVYDERDGTSTEFLNQQMAYEVIVPGEVAHVHDLCWTPFVP